MSDSPANANASAELIVGIDLGTTNSLVAYCDESGPKIIADEQGQRLLPSVVRFDPASGQAIAMGHEARRHAVEYPTETVFSVKRLMGRGIADVQGELAYLPYSVVSGPQDTARVQIGDRMISPPQVSAILLSKLRRQAEAYFGRPVRKAVITVPAYFDDAQRQATRDAGRLAGLQVVRIVNEPTAASLAYNLGLSNKKESKLEVLRKQVATCPTSHVDAPGKTSGETRNIGGMGQGNSGNGRHNGTDLGRGERGGSGGIAVFDLGGGTFDVSILRLETSGDQVMDQVLGTSGDTHLGGDDVDRMIVELIQKEIQDQFGQQIAFPPSTKQAFRNLAEATKINLSDQPFSDIEVDLGKERGKEGGKEGGERTYRRRITRDELQAMMTPWVDRAIDCCREALRRAKLSVSDIQRVVMVGGSTRIPLVRQKVQAFFQCEIYTAINPDEVVALGAAVQASILAGIRRDMLLLDVTPLSLGIETMGGAVAKLILANTTIPCKATERFSTYVDGQTNVKIHVLQGERELVSDCRSLATFDLKGIPPMPAGLPKLLVTFLVDANGILNVSAIEERSGKAASIQIVPNHGLTRQEIARIENESFAHAKEDMLAHRLIDLRQQAKLDLRNIDRQMQRVGSALSDTDRQTIEQAKAKIQALIDSPSPDPDTFYRELQELDHATVHLAEIAIRQTLAEQGVANDSASDSSD